LSYPKSYFRRRKRELIERRRAEKLETYEERRALALAKGVKLMFAVCPLCGHNSPVRFWLERKVPPASEYFFYEARYTFGRGSGFFLNEDESFKLGDPRLMEDPRGRRLVENLCKNVKRIYLELRELYPEQMGVRKKAGEKSLK